jgi:hypothetical protein
MVVVLALVVIGLVAYLVVSRNDSSSAGAAGPAVSPVAADQALAVSVNLHRSDLPSGWTVGPRVTPPPSVPAPVTAPATATATATVTVTVTKAGSQAVSTFAKCLGMPDAIIGQLFGDVPQADVGATAASPTF